MEAILKREIIVNKTAVRLLALVTFVVLTSLGAFVRIPLPGTPVPLTLQTFFVLLCAAFLGSGLGMAAQLGYLLSGVAGLPVFTGFGSGIAYLLGPTGGYIFGFILACLFAGRLIRLSGDNFFYVFAILCLADFFLLACGAVWLKAVSGCSLAEALAMGFIPFIPGDLLKALAASGLYLRLKGRLQQLF